MKSITKRRLYETGHAYSLLLPNLLLFACFSLFPVVWTLKFMFYRYAGIGTLASFVGLKNFARVFRDVVYWKSVLNTFVYAGGKILILSIHFQNSLETQPRGSNPHVRV